MSRLSKPICSTSGKDVMLDGITIAVAQAEEITWWYKSERFGYQFVLFITNLLLWELTQSARTALIPSKSDVAIDLITFQQTPAL